MPSLLFEIGVEEMPARYASQAIEQLASLAETHLRAANLCFTNISTMGTPRRLALFVKGLPEKQADVSKEVTGPPKTAAYDAEGRPTKALEGFLLKQNATIKELKFKQSPKGEFCALDVTTKGRTTFDIMSELLPKLCTSLNFPKSMRWVQGSPYRFARPIRHITAILDEKVVPFELPCGVMSGNKTWGHPFLSSKPATLKSASLEAYKSALKKMGVIVNHKERKKIIFDKISTLLAKSDSHLTETELLDEVTFLVEYPNAISCAFDESFLSVPQPVLVSAMVSHQRYFPVRDRKGALLPEFISVVNRPDASAATVREGNQRVLRARLSDAKFFFEQDMKVHLKDRIHKLKDIMFLKGMGTYFDKIHRLENMSSFLITKFDLPHDTQQFVDRAAMLCKADLVTEMVGEFPELQGVMGCEYARLQGEPEQTATAIKEHYMPRSQGDAIPSTPSGIVLSLAEKYDNICAAFSLGLKPTGSSDPYALRRQTIGVISIILKNRLSFSQDETISHALSILPQAQGDKPHVKKEVLEFMKERLYQMCVDEGYSHDIIRGALAAGFDNALDFHARLKALTELSKEPWWPSLVAVVERTYNIGKNSDVGGDIDESAFVEPEEKEVFEALRKSRDPFEDLIAMKDYKGACVKFNEAFAEPIHRFFEKVMVNVDDVRLRKNRLLLMKKINHLFTGNLADLSTINAK